MEDVQVRHFQGSLTQFMKFQNGYCHVRMNHILAIHMLRTVPFSAYQPASVVLTLIILDHAPQLLLTTELYAAPRELI